MYKNTVHSSRSIFSLQTISISSSIYNGELAQVHTPVCSYLQSEPESAFLQDAPQNATFSALFLHEKCECTVQDPEMKSQLCTGSEPSIYLSCLFLTKAGSLRASVLRRETIHLDFDWANRPTCQDCRTNQLARFCRLCS